ncbi:serine protease FAM111A-like [Osmerus mordax]|uniref:serine protease FAM111A-like n=1 Tax=Osmerus mordax TaxID=8014 RepID=UPI00350FE8F1
MKLFKLSGSVCKINAAKQGTGFLLFDGYIITNAHLLENDKTWHTDDQILHCEVTAIFENENTGTDHVPLKIKPVIINLQCGFDYRKRRIDFVILELEDHNFNVNGLLCHYGPQPNSGGVCIIGHPDGKVKTMDSTIIIGYEKREETLIKKKGKLIDTYFLMNDAQKNDADSIVSQKNNIVTYHTCLFHGASGSPVFDDLCQVIGIHTGGLPYAKDKSYIEYAIPLRTILENFLLKMTEGNKGEILPYNSGKQ